MSYLRPAIIGLLAALAVLPAAPAHAQDATGQIAFTRGGFGSRDIYVMTADGSGQTNLTNSPADDYELTWSPDGSRIAFTSDRDGNTEIYVMNADGSGQTNLTNSPASESQPAWSPDGSRIAFSSSRDGVEDIFVMNADGSGQTKLTDSPFGFSRESAWSPA